MELKQGLECLIRIWEAHVQIPHSDLEARWMNLAQLLSFSLIDLTRFW